MYINNLVRKCDRVVYCFKNDLLKNINAKFNGIETRSSYCIFFFFLGGGDLLWCVKNTILKLKRIK